jgi:prophage antirepressor-like protein
MAENQIVWFENTQFTPIDVNGKKWVTTKRLAEALGYSNSSSLSHMIQNNLKEFRGKTLLLKLGGGPGRPTMLINYHGVIRAAMLSDAPRAIEFRDWAEEVLFAVMTTGGYNDALITKMIESQNEINLSFATRIKELQDNQARTLVPAQQDNRSWPTPTGMLRAIHHEPLPKYFNRGASFDIYCSLKHAQVRGVLLPQRDRGHRGKMPDYVIQPNPENHHFVQECFKTYQVYRNRAQHELKLVPLKSTVEKLED